MRPMTLRTVRDAGLALLMASAIDGALSSAQAQTWYQQCVRNAGARFQYCLRTRAISHPGQRYRSCAISWRYEHGACWTNYQRILANRARPNFSNRPLTGNIRGRF